MKIAPLFVLLFLPLLAFGKDPTPATAYKALHLVGAERDHALLHRVIEVKGRNGAPQPEKWVVVLDDPIARGGVREIEVANRRIVSERTPVKTYSGSSEGIVMNFQKLNLDSDGAFTLAEQQARNARIGFHAVDYVLRCEESNAAPTWVLQLLDEKQRNIGSIVISADNGAVLSTTLGRVQGSQPGTPDVPRSASDPAPESARSGEDLTEDDARTHARQIGHRIDKVVHQIGANFQEFFTGRRTLDRRFRDDDGW